MPKWGSISFGLVSAIVSLVLTMMTCIFPQQASARSMHALVIGNSAYQQNPLRNPVNDAHDIDGMLQGLGFSVELHTDADQRTMEEAVGRLARKLAGDNNVGLFYFAGHGVEHQGRNYLIPLGAGIKDALDLKYKAVDAGYVLDGMAEAGNGLNMVILDACRNNPFRSLFRSSSRGLARMSPARGTLVLYATQPGAVAGDGPGRNGIFTKHLLSVMRTPNLEIEQVFKRTALAVDRETGGAQTPWVEGVVLGRFVFRNHDGPPESELDALVQPPPPPPPVKIPTGHLQVNVSTPARVELDGRYVGNAAAREPLNLSNVAIGDHRLTVTSDDGRKQELRPSIQANQWTQEVVIFDQRVMNAPSPIEPAMVVETGGYWSAYSHVSGPSFQCSAATQPSETLICSDATLRKADGIMGEIYQDLRQALSKSDADRIRSDQRQWIRDRDRACPVSNRDLESSSRSAPAVSCLLVQIQARSNELWDALSRTALR